MTDQDLLYEIMQKEIAKELLIEVNPEISDDEINEIWVKCKGNPFSAPVLYQLIKLSTQGK